MKENDKSELLRETLLSTAIFFHNLFLFHLLYSRVQTCAREEVERRPVHVLGPKVSLDLTCDYKNFLLLVPCYFLINCGTNISH